MVNWFLTECQDHFIVFSTYGTVDNWIATYKRMKLNPYIIPYPKINSK